MIKRWKKERSNLLVLDAGDLLYPNLNTPPSEDRKTAMNLKAEAIVAAFNLMGTDAITIGHSDLLWGKQNLVEILKEAGFPVISANLIDNSSGTLLFQPYIVREMHGVRVGILGLSSIPPGRTDPRFAGLTVQDPLEIARQMVSSLREKADLVILLSNLGYPKDLDLAKQVQGINVIVGGQTGINLSHPRMVGNTMVLQVGKKGRYLGKVDITIKDPDRPFVDRRTQETLQRRLQRIETQLEDLGEQTPEDSAGERKQRETLSRQKSEAERYLRSYETYNLAANRIVPLTQDIASDPECEKTLKPYLIKAAEAEKTTAP